ncbi:MAG: type IV toxin-antitoxin system AbiEi family antitoxin domain-containing protein [Solirubrobacteraceae bacterium]
MHRDASSLARAVHHRDPAGYVPRTGSAGTTLAPVVGTTPARSDWDRIIVRIADDQHGVVARRQLIAAGLSGRAIEHRVAQGRLHPVYRGVYAVGRRQIPTPGRWMAAVLVGGDRAVLAGRSAAALWGLVDGGPYRPDIEVPSRRDPSPGVRATHARAWVPGDRATRNGIPCLSVARVLVDLAAIVSERQLDRMIRRAEDRRVFDRFAVEEVLSRRRPGTIALRAALAAIRDDIAAERHTKSELERRFLEMLERRKFAMPQTNVIVSTPWGDHEVDTLWPDPRIVIELDGWWTHGDRQAFRRDHRMGADLRAAGYELVRLDWDQVVVHEVDTIERLARFLPRRNDPGIAGAVPGGAGPCRGT